jgi:hypothetical protein
MGCKTVRSGDVTGRWVVTDQSREHLLPATQRKAAAEIDLNPNGTFAATEIPEDLLYVPPEVSDQLVTGEGVWDLVLREGRQQVILTFKTIQKGQRGRVPYETPLEVSSTGWSTTTLFYFQGDPDEGRTIEFAKKKN